MKLIRPVKIDDTGSFTRASVATYYDKTGTLQSAAINVPRFTYDPSTLTYAPYFLKEAAATNLILRSQEFDNASWNKTLITVGANSVAAPDGTTTAETLTKSSGVAYCGQTVTFVSGVMTVSVFVKAATVSGYFSILFQPTYPNRAGVTFNLNTGVVMGSASPGGSTTTVVGASITAHPNGWYRCTFTVNIVGAVGNIIFAPTEVSGNYTDPFAGTVLANAYVWGAQLETGAVATSYIGTTSATVTRSADVNTARMVSPLPETDQPVWSSVTTYALAARVMIASAGVHNVYQSLQASNLNHDPQTSPTWWVFVSTTNKYAMFDNTVESQSVGTDHLVVGIQMDGAVRADSVILQNIANASGAKVRVVDPIDGVIYDNNINLISDSGITNLYDWFMEPISYITDVAVTDIPAYAGLEISVSLIGTGSTPKCGLCVVGQSREFGPTQSGLTLGIRDYSIKKTDDWGNTTLKNGSYAKTMSLTAWVDNNRLDALLALLNSYRATPIVYIGSEEYTSSVLFGYYTDYSNGIDYPTVSTLHLQIESMI